jgi:hypothetical protein
VIEEGARLIAERGDLAHLALFGWAAGASSLLVFTLRELVHANRRFSCFVAEIATLNASLGGSIE